MLPADEGKFGSVALGNKKFIIHPVNRVV